MAFNVSNGYKTVIYSGDAKHKILLKFNNIEVENANIYVEKLTVKSRILPIDEERFSLCNFISKEVELIMHDFDVSNIVDQVYIAIGTLVGEAYEYVPIGIFNIQDKPVTDKNKVTISLRDNSIKFDKPYNAKPLIDLSGGQVAKLQILLDICSTFGVDTNITSFLGDFDLVGIYDNTINARMYISYLAEQAGKIATIDRSGKLIFIDLSSLTTWNIDYNLVEKYVNGDNYKISKVEYEDLLRKFESGTNNYNTLFINTANPYISKQEQIDSILSLLNGFSIDSFNTGKILGNPAIDPFDLISIVYEGNTYVTLANNTLIYSGTIIQTFDTQISLEDRETNVSLNGEASFKKYAKTSIDNINAEVQIATGKINEQETKMTEMTQTAEGQAVEITNIKNDVDGQNKQILDLETTVQGIDLQISKTGGSNIFQNPVCYFFDDSNSKADDWDGTALSFTNTEIKNNTISGNCFFLQNDTLEQTIQVPNGTYTVSLLYKKLLSLATCKVNINGQEIILDGTDWTTKNLTFEVFSNTIDIKLISDNDNSCYLSDLMGSVGSLVKVWSNNPSESVKGGVKIGSGIEITSSASNIKQTMNNDGNRIINTNTNETVSEFTDKGMDTKEINSDKGNIAKVLMIDMGTQTWWSRI